MSSETLDCRSHSCYFAVDRSGQRNNGPCRCLPDLSPPVRTQIRMAFLAKVNHEREKHAKIAAGICVHPQGPGIKCEFGQAPELIAQRIRES